MVRRPTVCSLQPPALGGPGDSARKRQPFTMRQSNSTSPAPVPSLFAIRHSSLPSRPLFLSRYRRNFTNFRFVQPTSFFLEFNFTAPHRVPALLGFDLSTFRLFDFSPLALPPRGK